MKKLLLVRGFGLSNDSVYNEYKQIYVFFRMSKYKLKYFKYRTEEPLDQVYCRLENTIKKGKYSLLMAHSVGGALLAKYCRENDVSEYDKIILLMPFIRASSCIENCLKFEFAKKLRIPTAFLLLNLYVVSVDMSIFSFIISVLANDSFGLIDLHQPFYAKENLFMTNSNIIDFFRFNQNIHLIHSPTDGVVSFDNDVLSKIKRKYMVEGGHLSFAFKKYSNTFFEKLLYIINV
jgi:hypothetical protein